VKYYNWNPDKNEVLKADRSISFEEIVFHIEHGNEIDVFDHPNQKRYPGQKISVVIVDDYTYLVPYIKSKTEGFIKTIIPSRNATKKYVGT
jgi:putative transposon-encoded protein